MKRLVYEIVTEINHGTQDEPKIARVFVTKKAQWSEANEEIAKKEAFKGQYTIEDDGKEPPVDRVAELEQALDMLLSGVTE